MNEKLFNHMLRQLNEEEQENMRAYYRAQERSPEALNDRADNSIKVTSKTEFLASRIDLPEDVLKMVESCFNTIETMELFDCSMYFLNKTDPDPYAGDNRFYEGSGNRQRRSASGYLLTCFIEDEAGNFVVTVRAPGRLKFKNYSAETDLTL